MSDRLDLAIWLESQELSKVCQDSRSENQSNLVCGKCPCCNAVFEEDQQYKQPNIQVHLNFWKLPDCNAFDIGIDFPVLRHGKVNIFINTQNDIKAEDITQLLKTDVVINTIFNEFISTTSCPKETSCRKAERQYKSSSDTSSYKDGQPSEELSDASGHKNGQQSGKSSNAFCLCCFANPIRQERKFGGTLITFSISNHRCDRTCGCSRQYIRLRLTGDGINKLYIQDEIPSSKFEYYTSKIEFLDFRLNNVRSLPPSLLEYRSVYPNLEKVRCFLMLESEEDLSLYSKDYKKVRAIEKENWRLYIDGIVPYIQDKDEERFWDKFTANGKKKKKAILAYQWNTEESEPDFSLFAEIKRSEFSIRTLWFSFKVCMFLGVPSFLFGELIKYLWGIWFK